MSVSVSAHPIGSHQNRRGLGAKQWNTAGRAGQSQGVALFHQRDAAFRGLQGPAVLMYWVSIHGHEEVFSSVNPNTAALD